MLDLSFQKSLSKDKYIYIDDDLRVITVFDFHFFSRNDYDHLSPRQRKYIKTKLQELSFTQSSGSLFIKESINIFVSKSINLGVSPLPYLIKDLKKYNYVITTPTSIYLYYLSKNIEIERIKELITKCPVNLDQARDFSIDEVFYQRLLENHSSLNKLQKENEKLHKFKRL